MNEENSQIPQIPIQQISIEAGNIPAPHLIGAGMEPLITENTTEARTKRHFTLEEDNQIRQLVNIHGTNQWALIASQMPNRNPRQVRDRYRCYLSPSVVRSEWTIEDDKNLIQLVGQIGKLWAQLVKFFPGRTDVDLKNHWNKLQRHAKKIQPNSVNILEMQYHDLQHQEIPSMKLGDIQSLQHVQLEPQNPEQH